MRKSLIWLAAAAVVPAAAQAQAAPPAKPPASPAQSPPAQGPPAGTVGEVVVTGDTPVRTAIDRQSYSVANDLQATTGSISDALRSIPSVEVDVNGNVSLRGDPNVTVLIDGKPSGMFRGEGRGQALQGLPADRIERVEVITNPSAAFNPEGSAGVINLVTKKNAPLGYTASVRANVGSSGRQNASASGSRKVGKLSFTGDASFRHDSQKQTSRSERETFDPVADGFRRSASQGDGAGSFEHLNLRGGVDYDRDARTRISLEVRVARLDFEIDNVSRFDEVGADGLPSRAYDRLGRLDQTRDFGEAVVSYRWKESEDHELFLSLTRERHEEDRRRGFLNRLRVPQPGETLEDLRFRLRGWRTQLKADYTRPLGDEVKLKVGYAYDADDNDYSDLGFRGPSAAALAPDPSLTNLFRFDQQVHAAYVTYERPLGPLAALAGLRLESTQIDVDQATQGIAAENDYVRAYPSLHLRYQLVEGQQLRASYSRRIQRPQPADYNPFRVYLDPQNFREGNPDLKPQTTDSFELGYEYRRQGQIYLATLYYRDVRDAVNDVTRDLGDGVFLSRRENVGQSRAAGLELVANGRITRKLSYNVSGNAFWTEIDGSGLGFGSRRREAVTLFGRGNLNWQVTDSDFLQVNAFVNGKRLTPQGYVRPTGMLNLGYRRKFDDRFSVVVTAQDVLSSFRERRVIDTPTLRERVAFEPSIRGVFVGFTYAFGGRQRDPGFDFQGGGAPPSLP